MEEEAKRRTLLRYIHAVKAAASLGLDDESHKNMNAAVGRPGRGIIQVRVGGEGCPLVLFTKNIQRIVLTHNKGPLPTGVKAVLANCAHNGTRGCLLPCPPLFA